MKHEEAIQTNAAEGYVLGDLTEIERDAFEEHFADCETCFADVRDGARFTSILHETVVEEPVPVPRSNYKAALVAAASVVLSIAGLTYQHVAVVAPLRAQLAKARETGVVPFYRLEETRAEEQLVKVDSHSLAVFEFDVPPDLDTPPYTCKIADAKGTTRIAVPITAEQARTSVRISSPAGALSPGNYTLKVSGTRGVSVFEKRFTVQ